MATKLTLRMNEKLINNAKKIAQAKGVSLSRLVSDYFQTVSSQQKKAMIESPILSEVAGILSSKADKKGKLLKAYKKHVEEKYL